MSMGPLHGAVLGAAGLVSSPALWLTLVEGTLPLGDALIRFLVSVVICWAALNLVAQMVGPRSAPARVPGAESADEPAGQVADRATDPATGAAGA